MGKLVGVMDQIRNMANDLRIRSEARIMNPIQELLEYGMEDLNRERDWSEFWCPCPIHHRRPIV